jgi:hypothetical protein
VKLWTIVVAAGLMPACAGGYDALKKRAAFDLSCTEEKLTVVSLQEAPGCIAGEEICTSVAGVSGCDNKATYVKTDTGSWVLNSDSQPKDGDQK